VQLRQDNKLGTLYNMVRFRQAEHGAQQRVFRTIPGLETPSSPARRLASQQLSFNSPKLLDAPIAAARAAAAALPGQMTGAKACGIRQHRADGRPLCRKTAVMPRSTSLAPPPATTALGSLLGHITGATSRPSTRAALNSSDEHQFRTVSALATRPPKCRWGTAARNDKTVARSRGSARACRISIAGSPIAACAAAARERFHEFAQG